MHLAFVLALAVGSVTGVVTSGDAPLPGCTITLSSPFVKKLAVSNAEGRYRFYSVEPGGYVLRFELEGLESEERFVAVADGTNEQMAVDLRPSEMVETITITTTCGGWRVCQEGTPASMWDLPSCSEHELNATLIESLKRGDQSPIELLRSRYAGAKTYREKHTIARALLRNVPDDTVYWNELFEHAARAVRVTADGAGHSEEFVRWCQERLYEPDEYLGMAQDAFINISDDPRSRALLLEVLERNDSLAAGVAITGLATQRDLAALPAIARTLEQSRNRPWLVPLLASYQHEEADRLALRYLDEKARAAYLETRNQ